MAASKYNDTIIQLTEIVTKIDLLKYQGKETLEDQLEEMCDDINRTVDTKEYINESEFQRIKTLFALLGNLCTYFGLGADLDNRISEEAYEELTQD